MDDWTGSCSTASAAPARWPGTRSATSCSPASTEVLGDPVAALDEVAALVGARGRVLPMSREPLDIEAEVTGLEDDDPRRARRIRGQVAVASTPGRVRRVRLLPERPPACAEAVEAVRSADLLLLGPGSWFTSVLPHLLVPGLRDALVGRPGAKGDRAEPGARAGGDGRVLARAAPGTCSPSTPRSCGSTPFSPTRARAGGPAAPGGGGAARPVRAGPPGTGRRGRPITPRHDPRALAAALAAVVAGPDRRRTRRRCRRGPEGDGT